MISFNTERSDDTEAMQGYKGWVDRYEEFLWAYGDENQTDAVTDCEFGKGADKDRVCKFDLKTLGACGKGNFGYEDGNPCS